MNEVFQLSMSPTVGKIAAALAKAQKSIGPARRDGTNPHFKNSYATLGSCIEAVKPLHDHGIAVLQPPISHGPDGVCVATLLVHESGEWIRGELYMPASKKDAQGFGSALSYARRYCLSSTLSLSTDDDDAEGARVGGGGDLTAKLSASIDDSWPKFEERQAETLKASKTMGALQESWTDVYELGRKLDAPAAVMTRLAGVKDTMKASLKPANGKPADA